MTMPLPTGQASPNAAVGGDPLFGILVGNAARKLSLASSFGLCLGSLPFRPGLGQQIHSSAFHRIICQKNALLISRSHNSLLLAANFLGIATFQDLQSLVHHKDLFRVIRRMLRASLATTKVQPHTHIHMKKIAFQTHMGPGCGWQV